MATNQYPVDLEQMTLISDGNVADCQLLVDVYLKETQKDLRRLRTAIDQGEVQLVYRISHSCAGASLSYGMSALIPVFRQIESKARSGQLSGMDSDLREIEYQFQRVQVFLTAYLSSQQQNAKAA